VPDHPPTLAEVIAKAQEVTADYHRILREAPLTRDAVKARDHRVRVAADAMAITLEALLDVCERDREQIRQANQNLLAAASEYYRLAYPETAAKEEP
jgi:hypothetical protein